MTKLSSVRIVPFLLLLLLSLTSLAGANELAAQARPTGPTPLPPPSLDQLNDPSIPPLVGGAPATPKQAVDAPRDAVNPGTLFQSAADAPAINVWYGTNQTFGPNGDPQKWINIVGNVTSATPLSSLTYSLNGGPTKVLSIGPNGSRLVRKGDFNIELDYTDLQAGANTVSIVATDNIGGITTAPVIVNYQAKAGGWPSQTYTIDWSTATKVNDVAQVVDGNWMISGGKARVTSGDDTGFDRLIAVGDISWRNYTVTVPVTIHTLDFNRSPGVGVIVRWQGHFDNNAGKQPLVGWKRLGAMAWYRYDKASATEGLQLLGHGGGQIGSKGYPFTMGTTYIYKVSISPDADPTKPATYRFKVWIQGQAEPAAWDIEAMGVAGEPRNGSIVLVAHNADVSFGNVTINLTATEPKPELTVGTTGTGSGSVNPTPAQAVYRFGEDVTLTAVPNAGSTFAGWQGDATGMTSPTSVEMFADRNVIAQFSNPNVQTPISDDFNGCQLNPQLWTFINPLSDASVTLTGAYAEISVPAGTTHDLWTSGRTAPRIMQFADDGDFELSAKFDSPMSTKNQAQGIVIEQDDQNYLRFNFLHDGNNYKVQAFYFTAGVPTEKVNNTLSLTAPPMYLRVKRIGDVWNLWHSADGSTWSLVAGFSYPITVQSYGVYAGNSNQNPAHVAKVDYFFNMSSPIVPEDNNRKLNITTTGSGSVTRNVEKDNYACDEPVQLTPMPDVGYKFDSWSGDLTGTTIPATLIMDATKNVTANFVPDVQYQVFLSAVGLGKVEKSPDKDYYSAGEQVTLTATPDLGNTFVNWSGGATGSVNPLTVTVNSNLTIAGNFAAAPNRTLTLTPIGNGTISANPPGPTYLHGQKVTLTPVPGANASFTGWGGAASGMVSPLEITMDADKTVTATFKDNIYTLTLIADPADKGSVTPNPQKDKYYEGEVVQLTPNPVPGYKFAGWSGDLSGDDVPGELVMTKNATVTATFIPGETYTLTVNIAGGDGTVIKTPSKTEYGYNEQVTLDAQAGPGFEFVSWSGDYVGTDNPATVTITKDMVITANFAGEGIYSLTIVPPTNGSINVNPVRDLYAQNQQVTLTPMPAPGYIFSGWGGDASGMADPLILTMTGDKTISATFIVAPNYNLNVTTSGPGSVSVDPPGTQFVAGSTVTLTATAAPGYVFTGWSGDLVSNNNPYPLLMDGDKNIVANFGEAGDVVSDDFSGCGVLNPLWTWVDPLGQADYEMTGTQVKITVPPEVNYEIWKDGNNSARLVEEVANTNFEIIAKIDSPVTQGYQTQGVLIETDNDTFLRVDFHHDGTELRFFGGTVDNGSSRNRFNIALTPPTSSAISIRVVRNGDTFRIYYRYDEDGDWVNFKGNTFKFSMDVERVGVFASTQPQGAQPAPGHTALFDYFFNAAQPIDPEDAGAPAIIVTPVGQGSVTLTPNATSYACGQQVQLKATPAAGWRFQNWSVGLNGSNPMQTLTVSGRHEVTATFIRLEEIKLFLPLTIR